MQIKTLWAIILKIFGIYLVYSAVILFVFVLATLNGENTWAASLLLFITEAVFGYLFLFKTDFVIQRFRLEESIPEKRIDAHIEIRKILRIAIMVIGIYSLTESIPEFIGNLPALGNKLTLLSLLKVILGFLLVVKSPEIESWISSRQSS